MSIIQQQFGPIALTYYLPSQDGWNTGGVDVGANGTFLNPDFSQLPSNFLPLGSRAITDSYDDGAFLLVYVDGQAVVPSEGWQQIWNTEGVDGGENGWCWQPIAPEGYVALGCVFTNYGTPSFRVACVAQAYVTQGEAAALWSTAGVDGGADLSLYTPVINSPNTPPSSDLDASIAIPTTAFTSSTPYLLYLPTPYQVAPTQANPPALSGTTSPGETTPPASDGYVTVPYSLVDADNNQTNAWKAQNSPFYTLVRTCYWTNVGFLYNQTSNDVDLSQSLTVGVTESSSKQFSHTVGITVGAEGGVSFLGTGGKVSVSVNYQFNYTTQNSRAELRETTEEVKVPVAPGCAAIIWLATRQMMLTRTDGSQVDSSDSGSVLTFNGTIYVADQYPSTCAPKIKYIPGDTKNLEIA